MNHRHHLAALLLLTWPSQLAAQVDELTEGLRELLQAQYRELLDITFEDFSCEIELPLGVGDRFYCRALDNEGDRFRFGLEVSEEGEANVYEVALSPSGIEVEDRERLTPPCERFLRAFGAGDWESLVADLHPALQKELEDGYVLEQLKIVREAFGRAEWSDPRWYTQSTDGDQGLEYSLDAEVDGGVARFRVAFDDQETLRLVGFIVTAEPGSAASLRLIDHHGRVLLSRIVGKSVSGIEGPLERLRSPGDLVDVTATLADGSALPVVVEQRGQLDDFETKDYFYAVLDTEMIVSEGVKGRLEGVTSVECAAPVVPDGGEVRCVVEHDAATALQLILSRRGTEHRLRTAPAGGR